MSIVYKLPVEKDMRNPNLSYESFFDAKEDLIDFGTNTTRALFRAAQITFEVLYPADANNPLIRDDAFLQTLFHMRYNKIVLAGETDNVDDIVAVGSYNRPSIGPNRSIARLSTLAVLPQYQRRGVGVGFGSVILEDIEATLANQGAKELRVTPSFGVGVSFYTKHDYKTRKDIAPDMYKNLQRDNVN